MSLGEHLEELRTRLVRSLLAILVAGGFAFWRIRDVMAFMKRPIDVGLADPKAVELIQMKAYGAFLGSMKIAFFTGCVLAAPVVIYQLWAFVAAGLYRHERRVVKYYAFPGLVLFFSGAAMAYFYVLPWSMRFLVGFADGLGVNSKLDFPPYISMVAFMMLAFGMIFQLPMIMIFLMRLGVVEPDTFRRYRRHAIVVNFAVAMIMTPPDVVSQCVMALCMTALYEGAILVGTRIGQPRQEQA